MKEERRDEAWLRKKLRDAWRKYDDHLVWVEAARGGSVGAPDCWVPIPKFNFIPLELKTWENRTAGVDMKMRPSQRRFHRLTSDADQKSAFLFNIGSSIGLIIGHHAVEGIFIPWWLKSDLSDIRLVLRNKQFWNGNKQQ